MNPVHNLRFRNAIAELQNKKVPMWGLEDIKATLAHYGFEVDDAGVETFWTWFCCGHIRSVSNFTAEEILWGIERFIEEFSPIDDDKYES